MCAGRATFLEMRREQPDLSFADARKQSGAGLLANRLGALGGIGAEEAVAQARREQLDLVVAKRSDSTTGFEGVSTVKHRTSSVVSFSARLPGVRRGGKLISGDCLGVCTTAAEAALLLARAKARARAQVL